MSDLTDRLRCFDRQTCTEAADRIEALEAELAAMRAGGEPVAEMVPCYTPSGKRVAVISRFQHLPIGTKLYTTPQPTQAQAGAVPLTDAQIDQAIAELGLNYLADAHATNRAVLQKLCRHAHSIKGGQHDV